MNSLTSGVRYRQRVVKYSYKHSVTKAGVRFSRNRQAVYEWRVGTLPAANALQQIISWGMTCWSACVKRETSNGSYFSGNVSPIIDTRTLWAAHLVYP